MQVPAGNPPVYLPLQRGLDRVCGLRRSLCGVLDLPSGANDDGLLDLTTTASVPPFETTAALQLSVSAVLLPVLQLSVLTGNKLDISTAASPAGLVSSSAAVALQSVGRFQLTTTGKQLVDLFGAAINVCTTFSSSMWPAFRSSSFSSAGSAQCSYRVQQFDTVASSVLDGALITADVQPTFETYAEAFLQAPGRTSAQVDCALPIFDQAFAGDEHTLASGNWFLDSGAKRNYVVNAGPGFHTLPPEHQPCIGTAGDAVLYGVAVR